ncbi:tyrosyl-DNA phosphodiesterase 2-like isoform X2 [Convolutriloba macropyga]|uniref:tyrosyl-DNA phosphodiesterase 2-like isoform X2 n=1 Tax=Convolutriloba macropyga TaxID=536237 RepID=UPI003F5286DB
MADRIQLTSDQQQLVYAFAQATDCDLDLAYCLLSENNWQFNVTLQIYEQLFADQDDNIDTGDHEGKNQVSVVQKTLTNRSTARCETKNVKTEVIDLDDDSENVAGLVAEDDESYVDDVIITLRIMTWNVDCLSEKLLKSRMIAIFNEIKSRKPDIVMLQEIIDPVLMSLYDVFLKDFLVYKPDTDFGYFVVMLVRKSTFSNVNFHTIKYTASDMGRNLIRCDAEFLGIPMSFYTTHLESTKAVYQTRVKQLQQCVNEMTGNDVAQFKLLAGDLNLRDAELTTVEKMSSIKDAWIESGSVKESQYTWDMSVNDNLENMKNSKVKCRFDRVYYISEKHTSYSNEVGADEKCNDRLELKSFELIGKERLGCGMFPSDHFGILTDFKLNLT